MQVGRLLRLVAGLFRRRFQIVVVLSPIVYASPGPHQPARAVELVIGKPPAVSMAHAMGALLQGDMARRDNM